MTGHLKTGAAIVALLSLGLAGAALADRGPRGGEGRGDMLLQMFDTIDGDTDGKITEAEFDAHRAAEFAAADANSDGLLSAEELAQQRIARMTAQAAEQSARMIERMDANDDGSLSAEEMDQTPRDRRFARMDTDNDGAISKAEAEAATERFAGGRKHGRGMGGGMGQGMGMEN